MKSKWISGFFKDRGGDFSMMRLIIFTCAISALIGAFTGTMSDTLVTTILGIAVGGKGLQKFGEKGEK